MYYFQWTILTRATDNFADVLVTHAKDLGCQRCSYFCSQGRRIYRFPDRLLDYCCCTTYSESLKRRKCIIVFVTSTLDRWAIDGKVSKRVNKNINVEMGFSHKQMGKTILKLFVWHPFWKPCLLDIIREEQWCTSYPQDRRTFTSVFDVFVACTLRCGVNLFVPSTCCY